MKLICPICRQPLQNIQHTAVCPSRHAYDYAASGYLNLLRKEGSVHGDNADMIRCRTVFLESGAYAFLRTHLKETALSFQPHTLIDLGCGEGYYTKELPGTEKYGFDLSKTALRHAAKNDPGTQYVLSSIFHLPLPDTCADLALTCFAPVAEEEIIRLLEPHGHFILVTPGEDHLYELKEQLYETPYKNPDKEQLKIMTKIHDEVISEKFTAGQDILNALFYMTPYAVHTGDRGRQKLASLGSLKITAQFRIRIYEKP